MSPFSSQHPRTALEGATKQALEIGRTRILVAGALFSLAFIAIGLRLADLTIIKPAGEPKLTATKRTPAFAAGRADIVDRNGVLLATSLNTASLYANPHQVLDAREAADKIARALPGIAAAEVLGKLRSDRSFVWIKRHLTPDQQYAVNAAGIPGLYFQREERRVYPQGRTFAHVLGFAGTDGTGGTVNVETVTSQLLYEIGGPEYLGPDVTARFETIELEQAVGSPASPFGRFGHDIGAVGDTTGDGNDDVVFGLINVPDLEKGYIYSSKPFLLTYDISTKKYGLDAGFTNASPSRIYVRRARIADFTGDGRKDVFLGTTGGDGIWPLPECGEQNSFIVNTSKG